MNSYIFDIKRGSTVDGPGIRTVIFLKGCPLNCVWCQNPESHSFFPEISYDNNKCVLCGECKNCCPVNAINYDNEYIINNNCNLCGNCIEACNYQALKMVGKSYSEDEVLDIILKDINYYKISGGGVTFSGGEPLSHMNFIAPIVKRLKKQNIHVTIETCGYFDFDEFKSKIFEYVDLIYFDLKFIDLEEHVKYTGQDNNLILTNFQKLVKLKNFEIVPGIPIIPAITSKEENIRSISKFLKKFNIIRPRLLWYNPGCVKKWKLVNKSLPIELPEKFISKEVSSLVSKALFGNDKSKTE